MELLAKVFISWIVTAINALILQSGIGMLVPALGEGWRHYLGCFLICLALQNFSLSGDK